MILQNYVIYIFFFGDKNYNLELNYTNYYTIPRQKITNSKKTNLGFQKKKRN